MGQQQSTVRHGTHDITADTCYTWNAEVKLLDSIVEASALEEGHDKRSQAAVDVHANVGLFGQSRKVGNGILTINNALIPTPGHHSLRCHQGSLAQKRPA
jgi:hypothetical protein